MNRLSFSPRDELTVNRSKGIWVEELKIGLDRHLDYLSWSVQNLTV